MRPASRFIATVLAAIVWGVAGYAAASGPSVPKAITPVVPDAAAALVLNLFD